MKYMKKALCVLTTMVVCLASTITAFADLAFTKEEAWQAITSADPKVVTRKYDIDCVDITELTTEDKRLIFDILWKDVESGEHWTTSGTASLENYLDDYYGSINDTFYGETPTEEKLQEIYQEAENHGFDTSASRQSHNFTAQSSNESTATTAVTNSEATVTTIAQTDGTIDANGMTTAATISTVPTATTAPEQEEGKTSPVLFVILGFVVVGIGTGLIITLRKQKK